MTLFETLLLFFVFMIVTSTSYAMGYIEALRQRNREFERDVERARIARDRAAERLAHLHQNIPSTTARNSDDR